MYFRVVFLIHSRYKQLLTSWHQLTCASSLPHFLTSVSFNLSVLGCIDDLHYLKIIVYTQVIMHLLSQCHMNGTLQFSFNYPDSYILLVNMGKRAVLSISEHKEVCTYRDHFPVTSQQNMANHISLSWDTTVSWCRTGYTLKEKTKWENLASANIMDGVVKCWKWYSIRRKGGGSVLICSYFVINTFFILSQFCNFNTQWTGDADLRLYITTVQDGWRTSAFLTRAWFPRTIHFNYEIHAAFLRMVLLTDVYRNVSSLWSNDLW